MNKINTKIDQKNRLLTIIENFLPWIFMCIIFVFDVAFLIIKGAAYIDSDMASDIVLADFLNHEGGLISKNWFYSTEIHIFSQQPFLQLGLKIFPDNWMIARAISVSIMLILITGLYFLYTKLFETNRSKAVWFAALMLCPFGYWYLHMVTFAGFYSPCLLFSLSGVLCILFFCNSSENRKKSNLLWIVLALVIAICAGVKSVRYIIFPYAPLIVAAFILLCYRVHEEPKEWFKLTCKEWRLFIGSLISLIGNLIGYLYNSKVLANRYTFQNMNEQTWGKLSFTTIVENISNFFSLFGYQNDEHANDLSPIKTNPNVFSLQGIACLFGIALILLILISSIRLLFRWNKLSFMQRVILVLYWSTLIVDGMIYSWTLGYDTNASTWISVVPFAFMILEIECATEDFSIPLTRKAVVAVILGCVMCTSYATVKDYQENPLYANAEFVNISKWLVENGYTEGYATYWNSNVLTALSNGKLEMWTVWNLNDRSIQAWLQKKDHLNPPTAKKVFAVVGPYDEVDFLNMQYEDLGKAEIIFTDDFGFTIIGYEKE